MPTRVGITCRKCRGILDCTNRDEYHKACKCPIDFRKSVVMRNALKAFLKDRCCTEGAANALLKGGTYRYHEGVEKYLAPACEKCSIQTVGAGSWRKSKSLCNWSCCSSFNHPCVVGLMNLLQEYPHRLKEEQAGMLEEIITAVESEEEAKPAHVVKFAPVKIEIEPREDPLRSKPAVEINMEPVPMDQDDAHYSELVPVPYSRDDAVVVADVDMSGVNEYDHRNHPADEGDAVIDMSGVDECDAAAECDAMEEDPLTSTIPEGTDVCGIFKWPRTAPPVTAQ